ncbi:MAG: YdcH family protein [Bryobacteraceae bacterium]
MEQLEELKTHLMATNEEFRTLAAQHAELKQQLQAIEAKGHLTLEDEDREHEIKKQKLLLKDQMNQMLARQKPEQVA